MDSPDQGASGVPMNETRFEDNELIILGNDLGIKYTGRLDGQTIVGHFEQSGFNIPLTLSRNPSEENTAVAKRPQDPQEPFPYKVEEVKFVNTQANSIKLAATLTIPKGVEQPPVAILISGSGPQNRNEELMNHRPFLVLADYLTRNGIAVLRYDDRGVAASEGDFQSATTADLSTDALAAFRYIKTLPEFSRSKVGFIGHSEGGMIAPMIAGENPEVDFIVLLAGPGIATDQLLLIQNRKIGEISGSSKTVIGANNKINAKLYAAIKNNPDLSTEALKEKITPILELGIKALPPAEQKRISGNQKGYIDQQAKQLLTPWFRYFIAFSPEEHLAKVKCPVLALNGSLDLQVSAKENLAGIEQALKKGGNTNFEVKEFAGLNHLFQKATTGAPSEYATIDETMNPEVLRYVAEWIR